MEVGMSRANIRKKMTTPLSEVPKRWKKEGSGWFWGRLLGFEWMVSMCNILILKITLNCKVISKNQKRNRGAWKNRKEIGTDLD
jgi:hypothetical protein